MNVLKTIILSITLIFFNINTYAKYTESGIGKTSGQGIEILAPKKVEIPSVVPISARFDNYIKSGDIVKFYVNNNLAYSVRPKGDVTISKFAGRIRAINNSGKLRVEVERNNGDTDSLTANFHTDKTFQIPSVSDTNGKYKLKSSTGKVKLLFLNKMGSARHISQIQLNTSKGVIFIDLTPYTAGGINKKPGGEGDIIGGYINITGNFKDTKVRDIILSK